MADYLGHNAPSLGNGLRRPLTDAELDAKFAAYVERSDSYNQAIRDAGELPWWQTASRRAKVAKRLGLPVKTPGLELRRALWERGQR